MWSITWPSALPHPPLNIELDGGARVWGLLLRGDGVLVVIREEPGPPLYSCP